MPALRKLSLFRPEQPAVDTINGLYDQMRSFLRFAFVAVDEKYQNSPILLSGALSGLVALERKLDTDEALMHQQEAHGFPDAQVYLNLLFDLQSIARALEDDLVREQLLPPTPDSKVLILHVDGEEIDLSLLLNVTKNPDLALRQIQIIGPGTPYGRDKTAAEVTPDALVTFDPNDELNLLTRNNPN